MQDSSMSLPLRYPRLIFVSITEMKLNEYYQLSLENQDIQLGKIIFSSVSLVPSFFSCRRNVLLH